MMRSKTAYATAVRRADGSIVLGLKCINTLAQRWGWARWPMMRGNFALLDSMLLGMESLTFSGNVAIEDEERAAAQKAAEQAAQVASAPTPAAVAEQAPPSEQERPRSSGMSGAVLWLSLLPALALGVGLFVLLPTWAVNWVVGGGALAVDAQNAGGIILRNLVEGVIRLALILGYMAAISLMPSIRRVFQYHGAEHQTINAFELGLDVTVDNALHTSPLHPRCGTAFILVVIVVKIFVNCFLGWPALWLRLLLRVAILPLIAGLAYEIIYYAGRNRESVLARALAWPGLMLQQLTTRHGSRDQVEVAVYALAAVAPEVELPAGLEPAPEVGIGPSGRILYEVPRIAACESDAAEPAQAAGD
ncbi:MAG TPA: DUF1385 domain-containing protein [Armatimonadota bacterium]|nr:DUF1385 domain-containing protein [Armatimonadota bacterium]